MSFSLFKFAEVFLSFFKSHSQMAQIIKQLLAGNGIIQTGVYLLAFHGWASSFYRNIGSNPDLLATRFLSEITVTCVMHNKMLLSPQHEFLIIETEDHNGNKTLLILEWILCIS
jgi:hypothetical protein